MGYNIRVTNERAIQREKEERGMYMAARDAVVTVPEFTVFIEETSKGRNTKRNRRYWFQRGDEPYFLHILDMMINIIP